MRRSVWVCSFVFEFSAMSSFELSEDEESQLFFHSVGLRTGESEVAWGRTGNLTSSWSAFRLLFSFPLDWLSSFASLVFLAHAPLPLDCVNPIFKMTIREGHAHGSWQWPALRHPLEIWGKVVIQFFAGDREPTLLFVNCKWKLNKR